MTEKQFSIPVLRKIKTNFFTTKIIRRT